MLKLEDFKDDEPWTPEEEPFSELTIERQIDGVRLQRLTTNFDSRGDLTVLMTDLYDKTHRTPHVYLVTAAAKSVRAWVYHKHQYDRLAYTQGSIRVVLYDLRTDSPTYGVLNVLEVGSANKVLLTIPPYVVHGVQNYGDQDVQFVNMPTRAYDPAAPDKSRVPRNTPEIPYVFA